MKIVDFEYYMVFFWDENEKIWRDLVIVNVNVVDFKKKYFNVLNDIEWL